MIKNIHDIRFFLRILDEFQDSKGIDQTRLFFLIQEQIKLIQWDFELEKILQLGISLNLFNQKNNRISRWRRRRRTRWRIRLRRSPCSSDRRSPPWRA